MAQRTAAARRYEWTRLGLLLCATVSAGASPRASDERISFMFQIQSAKGPSVAFKGEFVVDGREKSLPTAGTPYEFRCEAVSMLKGYFQAMEPGQEIRVSAFLPHVSKKRVGKAKG